MRPSRALFAAILGGASLWSLNEAVWADEVAGSASDPRNYGYSKASALKLGYTFDPANPTIAMSRPCLDFKEVRLGQGAASTRVTVNYVSSQEQLAEASGMDIKASASAWGASADADFSREQKAKFGSNRAVLVITARTDFGRWGLTPDTHLSAVGASKIADPPAFLEACGSRYVAVEWRGVSLSATVNIANISSELRDAIKREFGAKAKYAAVTGEMRAKFNQEITKANREGRVSVDITTTGGEGVADLGDVIKGTLSNQDPMGAIGQALAGAVKGFKAENAQPTEFQVRSLSDFGWDYTKSLKWTDEKEQTIRRVYSQGLQMQDRIAILESLLDGTSPWAAYFQDKHEDIRTELEYDKDFLARAKAEFRHCQDTKSESEAIAARRDYMPCFWGDKPDFSRIFYDLDREPKAVFTVMYGSLKYPEDGNAAKQFDGLQARTILSVKPESRPGVAQQYDADAGGQYAAWLDFEGFALTNERISLVDNDGVQHDIFEVAPITESHTHRWASSRGIPSMERSLRDWIAQYLPGTRSGSLIALISNEAGEETRLPLADVKWTSAEGKLLNFEITMVN